MKFIMVIFISAFLVACKSDNKEKSFEQKDKSFYPVGSFVKSELSLIDSMPVAVFKISSADGRIDTSIIEKGVLRNKAEDLVSPDITIPPLKDLYKETVFMDETINSVTLSYSTENPDAKIQKIDVFVNPDTEKVKYIYIEKNQSSGDSVILKKIIWTAGKHLQVTSIISVRDQPPVTLQDKYIWSTLE